MNNDIDDLKYNQLIIVKKYKSDIICKFLCNRPDKNAIIYENENKLYQCSYNDFKVCTKSDIESFYNNEILKYKKIKSGFRKSLKKLSEKRKSYNAIRHKKSYIIREAASELYEEYIILKLIGDNNYKDNSRSKKKSNLYNKICKYTVEKESLEFAIQSLNNDIESTIICITKCNNELKKINNEFNYNMKEGIYIDNTTGNEKSCKKCI